MRRRARDFLCGGSAPERRPEQLVDLHFIGPRVARELLGPELGGALTALYRGGDDWTSRAIDLLEANRTTVGE